VVFRRRRAWSHMVLKRHLSCTQTLEREKKNKHFTCAYIAYRAIKNLPTTDDQSTSRSWYEPSVPDYYIILCATIMGRYDTGHTKASSIHQHSCKLAHKDPPSSLPLKALTSSSSLSLSLCWPQSGVIQCHVLYYYTAGKIFDPFPARVFFVPGSFRRALKASKASHEERWRLTKADSDL
jgi:hypothetical protein